MQLPIPSLETNPNRSRIRSADAFAPSLYNSTTEMPYPNRLNLELMVKPVLDHHFALTHHSSSLPHNDRGMTMCALVDIHRIFAEADIIQSIDHGELSRRQSQCGEFWRTVFMQGLSIGLLG